MTTQEDAHATEIRETFTVRRLQERVLRLEAENKELKVNNQILQTQYTSQCETQSEILRTLHANLEENYSSMERSEREIQRLEELLEDQKQKFKDKLEEEKSQWENKVQGLQLQVDELEEKLNQVREFQRNKETLEAELAAQKQQLQDQAEAHSQAISGFDRKKAIDIDQLKKDMQRSIKEEKETLKARTKDQLDATTKRTIMENVQMETELRFQSKETERLLDRNRALIEENSQLRRNLQIHKDLENELARRTHVYQKLLKRMDQKLKLESSSMEQSREMRSTEGFSEEDRSLFGNNSKGHSVMLEEHEKVLKQMESVQTTLQTVRQEFVQYRRDHATLTQLQDQSTRLIISGLYELKNQQSGEVFPPASYDENADCQFANMTTRQKEYFFRMLLEKLNSSMCGHCFPVGNHAPTSSTSTTSLPQIGKSSSLHEQGPSHFSQFLWSVATHGGQPALSGESRKEVSTKSVQTETAMSDPCLQEGLWSPDSRSRHVESMSVSAAMVTGQVRPWGQKQLITRNPYRR